jgi:hypothetical protein
MKGLFMRGCISLLPVLLVSTALLSGQTASNQGKSTASKAANDPIPITVQGCMTGSSAHYTVATTQGDLYRLAGNDASLRQFNGKTVSITGTATKSDASSSAKRVLKTPPPKLTVSKIKKVFDTCE